LHHYDPLGLRVRQRGRHPWVHMTGPPQLITQVQAELDAGTDPAAARPQTLAKR
jgi:hypothetical protein